jgi:N-acetylgalactosamine-6-sulfatase
MQMRFKSLRLSAAVVVLLCGAAAVTAARPAQRPNIVLLLADDMGYADPGCFGGQAVPTPNLDRIAADGVKFTSFYAASAVCTPTRAAILTGQYPLRFDIRGHFSDDEAHLPRGVATLPKLLQQAGYVTGHVGKWHLGGLHLKHLRDRAASIPGPREHGFDHYQCQNEEQPLRGRLGSQRLLYRQGGTCLIRDEKQVTADDPYYDRHFTDINGRESLRLIRQFHRSGRPFFLNLWWLVPHTPYEPAPEPFWSQTAAPGISHDQHCFRSMVAQMDHHIGRLLDTLDELGIRDNTLVFFTSDNGGAYEADVGPYKGGKTDLHEAGLRVPTMVSWPGRIPAGRVSEQFGHSTDILPTLCAAAGIDVSIPVDGCNLLPHWTGGTSRPERGTVFWQIDLYRHLQRHYLKPEPYSKEIARKGPWKLLCFDGEPKELFHIENDPLERYNLLKAHPKIVKQLNAELKAWLAEPRLSHYEN